MNKLANWIKGHQIASFFILALAMMYIIVFPLVFLTGSINHPILQVLMLYTARLAVYIPVLVGMLVTSWNLPHRSPTSAVTRWLTFGIVWLVALIVSALGLRQDISSNLGLIPLLILSIPIALLPAFVISSAYSRVTSLRDYLSTLVRPRGYLVWYLFALLTFPVIHLLGVAITNLLAGRSLLYNIHFNPGIMLATLTSFASVFFYSGGVNEEGGWRGFAQRHLQANYSPLVTNLLLWAYLVILHVPNDIIQYREGNYLLVRIGLYPFITILFGWVYNRTRGSILAPALFHASMNSMNTLQTVIPGTNAGNLMLVLFAVFAILADRMWKKLPPDHPAVYQTPGFNEKNVELPQQ